MLRRKRRKYSIGQSTGEYAILILIILGAIAAMQLFLRRGHQAAIRHMVRDFVNAGTENGLDGTLQFEPYYFDKTYSRSSTSDGSEKIYGGGKVEVYRYSEVNKTGEYYENTLGVKSKDEWGWNKTIK